MLPTHASGAARVLAGQSHRWLWPVGILLLVALLAGGLGTDTDWDLRNYHAYSAHALLSGRFRTDIAAAQLQTYFVPWLDIAVGVVRDGLNDAPVLRNVVLAVPHALAVWLAFLLTLRAVPAALPGRALLAFAATLFAATGAAGYPLLATAMDDMLPGACLLGGLLLLTAQGGRPTVKAAWAGLLFGLAAGLKLTEVPYCVAGAVALLLVPERPERLRAVGAFVLAGVVAGAAVGGPWWALLYARYHNPILPFMNQWFHAPFVDPVAFTDERFKPHTWLRAVTYPFFWAIEPRTLVSELTMRDPRFALAYLALLAVLGRWVVGRFNGGFERTGRLLAVFFVAAFAVWELQFSIFRYIATLELLTGTMLLLALRPWLARPKLRMPVACGVVALGLGCAAMTVYPEWGRMDAPLPVHAALPVLAADSLVVLLDNAPTAYLAPLVPPAIRFVGANNNLIQPGSGGLLARQAETAIRTHAGPLYGVEDPVESPGMADRTLEVYRLRRDGCSPVVSNLDGNALRLCRLRNAGE